MNKPVFIALTSYQLLISDVYAKYIYKKFDIKPLIIYMQNNTKLDMKCEEYDYLQLPNLNITTCSRIWQRLYYSGRLFKLSPIFKNICNINNSILFVFNDYYPVSHNLIKIMYKNDNAICLIDEGIGTYAIYEKKTFNAKDLIRLFVTYMLGAPMVYGAIGESKEISYAIVSNPEQYKKKECSKKQIILKQDLSKIFSHSDDFVSKLEQKKQDLYRGDVLFLGQPLIEGDEYSELERIFIDKIIKELIAAGKKIVIKPHPRENGHKYDYLREKYKNVFLIDGVYQDIPVECLVSAMQIREVYAFNSSAAINIANMYRKIKVVLCYKFKEAIEICKKRESNNMRYDNNIFTSINNNLYIPESILEAISIPFKCNINSVGMGDEKLLFPEIDLVIKSKR